ncbi:MAG: hypothetical protein HN855_02475 [Anaerolineae bacterium]|jgi:glycerophosphoryl diester phosphodiesterase|nr:hypothetical protein [Anaerolineae bacterium]MBT7072010.1 hypothetical protein [Anaerolineae bacterium]MBT7324006.1 hypothetical protein [Anaerolineae bacterium]
MPNPLIIAHRGATQLAPENSIAAFKAAIEAGADAIEFDIHFSKDKQIIVHHDYFLGRTEDGAGFIGNYSYAELQKLDIGSKFDDSFSTERIPTLKDILILGKGKTLFEIELRCPTLSFLKSAIEEIQQAGVESDVELTSPHIPLLVHAKKIAPYIRTGVFFDLYPTWKTKVLGQQHILDWMVLLDAQVAHLPMELLEKDFVDALHQKNFSVHGANLNEKVEIEKAIFYNVDQFSTDRLETAISICASI